MPTLPDLITTFISQHVSPLPQVALLQARRTHLVPKVTYQGVHTFVLALYEQALQPVGQCCCRIRYG